MCEFGDEPTLNEADGVRVTERERAFYRALLDYEPLMATLPGPSRQGSPLDVQRAEAVAKQGGRILGAAVMGFTARDHAERHHPEQVDVYAEKAAPLFEPERAAWLFGYRWQP